MTCPATLADRGTVPCSLLHGHEYGHLYELIDADLTRDHEEDER